jgi:hypothetical protein
MDNSVVLVLESASVEFVPVVLGFEDLYRAEYPGLVAVATAMTGDKLDGEDLVQDTMVKTFIRWNRVGRLETARRLVSSRWSRLAGRGCAVAVSSGDTSNAAVIQNSPRPGLRQMSWRFGQSFEPCRSGLDLRLRCSSPAIAQRRRSPRSSSVPKEQCVRISVEPA